MARTARYYTLGDQTGDLRQIWFVGHGHGQLAAPFLEQFEALDDGHRLIVAPEALSRYYLDDTSSGAAADARVGATWMTREDRLSEIDDYVRYLDALAMHVLVRLDREAARVFVLGFSQGGATVSRWVARGLVRPDALIMWASGLAHDLDLDAAAERFRALRLSFVVGTQDPLVTAEAIARQEATLRAAGIPYEIVTFDGGHRLDAAVLRRLAEA